MFALLFSLIMAPLDTQKVQAPEVVFVLRFTQWPPISEEDKKVEKQLRVLMAHPQFSRIRADIPRDGGLRFRIWIRDETNTLQVLRSELGEQDPRWNDIRRRFPGIKIAISGNVVLLHGRTERVKAIGMMIMRLSLTPEDAKTHR